MAIKKRAKPKPFRKAAPKWRGSKWKGLDGKAEWKGPTWKGGAGM